MHVNWEPEYRIYVNVNWTGPVRDYGPARDGEADAVITHPEHGLLVLEVKSGEPSIDHEGHWHLGPIELKQSPFEQARTSKHYLRAKLVDLPDWPPGVDPLAGVVNIIRKQPVPTNFATFGLSLGSFATAEGRQARRIAHGRIPDRPERSCPRSRPGRRVRRSS